MIRFACWVCKQEFFALVDPPPRVCNDCAEASLAVPFLDTKDARIAELEAEVARLSVNGFGTSVDDSHELLKLRELLDDVGVWPSEKAEQDGDYEACVRHMAERIVELEARRRAVMCAYCGDAFFEYPSDSPVDRDHEEALTAFAAHDAKCARNPLAARIAELEAKLSALTTARELGEWTETDGPVLWWRLPVEEPPYVGSPLDDDFPDYVTHWTPLALPEEVGRS